MITFKKFNLISESTRELMSELYEQLEKYDDPLVGVHFSNGVVIHKETPMRKVRRSIPHLGLNFGFTFHGDPIGVYTFPKDYVLSGGLEPNRMFSERKFFHILKPSRSARILNLSRLTESEAQSILSTMGINPEKLNDTSLNSSITKKNGLPHKFWRLVGIEARKLNKTSRNIGWNILFERAGYDVLYDEGSGIIFTEEPSQIIYLKSSAFEELDVSRQKRWFSKLFAFMKDGFPDFKAKVNRDNDRKFSTIILTSETEGQIEVYVNGAAGLTFNVNGNRMSCEWEDVNSNLLVKLRLLLQNNQSKDLIVRSDKFKILEKISEEYGFSKSRIKGKSKLIKRYHNKYEPSYKLTMTIHERSSYMNDNERYVGITLKNSGKTYYYDHLSYHVSAEIPVSNREDINIPNLMNQLFQKLVEEGSKHMDKRIDREKPDEISNFKDDKDRYDYHYKYVPFIKAVSFLRRRVFHLD